jgi:hypothetical protein
LFRGAGAANFTRLFRNLEAAVGASPGGRYFLPKIHLLFTKSFDFLHDV